MITQTKMSIEYAHRFLGHKGEAQYFHGHHGVLEIDVEGTQDKRGFVVPVSHIHKIMWNVMSNFDHAILLQSTDPLLPELLKVYTKQGIRNSTPDNKVKGPAIKNKLVEMHPECRLVVTRDITTCENMIEIFYSLLKDKLNIVRMRFQSKDDVAAVKYFK